MNKNLIILLGVILIGVIAFNQYLPFSFVQPGRTINVEYGSNVEIWNTMVNSRNEPVYCQIDLYKDGRMYQQGQKYQCIEAQGELEYQLYDFYLEKNTIYDLKYVIRSQFDINERILESGSIRYKVNVGDAPNNIDILPPYIPPIGDEIDIPDDPIYDSEIQAVISATQPSPLSSGNYEVLVDDFSVGKITYWKLYQDDKLLYQGGISFKSFRAYIDPGQSSIFMIEVSNSGHISTAYTVVTTSTIPDAPIIEDYGMVASISSSNLQPFHNSEYTVDITDKSKGNIDQYILYQDDYEIYRGSSSFGTRNQIIPSGKITIFMIELQNEKAVATAYTVVDTTQVNIPSLSFTGYSQYSNMIILGLVALFVIWAFMGFRKPF